MKLLDRRFLNLSLTVEGIANEPADNPTTGTQYIVGAEGKGAFDGVAPNSIARFNGSAWKFFTPKAGSLEVIDATNGNILSFNGSAWVAAVSLSSPVTESHTLSAEEASNKSFSLSNNIAAGQENNILCFVSGIAQACGVDFSASSNSISWNSKGLDDIGLVEGDTFIVHYIKA